MDGLKSEEGVRHGVLTIPEWRLCAFIAAMSFFSTNPRVKFQLPRVGL